MDITGDVRLASRVLLEPLHKSKDIDEFPMAMAFAWASAYFQHAHRQIDPGDHEDRCRTCKSADITIDYIRRAWLCNKCGADGTYRLVRTIVRDGLAATHEINGVHGALDSDGDIVITVDIS